MSKEATKAAEERYPGSKRILPGQLNIAKSFQAAFINGWNAHESQQDKEMEEFAEWIGDNGYVPGRIKGNWKLGELYLSVSQLLSLFRERGK